MKKICITGGTGFVGTAVTRFLNEKGHRVVTFSRHPEKYERKETKLLKFRPYQSLEAEIDGSDMVFNLAGENLFDQRWTDKLKSRILRSRIKTTRAVVEAIAKASRKPEVLLSASAVGYYGSRGAEKLDEKQPAGDDFLARVCMQWEEEALEIESTGVRLVIPRLGIVLDKTGGALEKMITPFSLFVGGPLGNGKQYFPWVHMQDVCEAFWFAATKPDFEGIFNVSAPNPVSMKEFAKNLGKVMNRPSFFPVPEFALRLLVGEATSALIASQRVIPEKLQNEGFSFTYEKPYDALKAIL